MRIFFYSPVSFEPWNWTNSITTGIGGSETSVVEMSWRLARRGHDVTVYAPLPEESTNQWRRLERLGIKTWCDPRIRCDHLRVDPVTEADEVDVESSEPFVVEGYSD